MYSKLRRTMVCSDYNNINMQFVKAIKIEFYFIKSKNDKIII
jgi:hypothetical protein